MSHAFKRFVKRFYNFLLDLLFPPKCVLFDELLYDEVFQEGPLCDRAPGQCRECRQDLPWTTADEPEKVCAPATRCVAPLWYRDDVRTSFHCFKFKKRVSFARGYGKLMAQCVQDRLGLDFDLICWAPVSAKRLEERGYDQSELLARELAETLDRPVVPVLRKIKHTVEQSKLEDKDDRAKNAAGAYECANPAAVQDKRVLLVDDIVTSGSTLSNCAQKLLEAGAKEVWAAALARARW